MRSAFMFAVVCLASATLYAAVKVAPTKPSRPIVITAEAGTATMENRDTVTVRAVVNVTTGSLKTFVELSARGMAPGTDRQILPNEVATIVDLIRKAANNADASKKFDESAGRFKIESYEGESGWLVSLTVDTGAEFDFGQRITGVPADARDLASKLEICASNLMWMEQKAAAFQAN